MMNNTGYLPLEGGNGKYDYRHEAVRDGFASLINDPPFLQVI